MPAVFLHFQTAFVFKFVAVCVLFVTALGLPPAPYMGLASVGLDVGIFGCSPPSAAVAADVFQFGFQILSSTFNFLLSFSSGQDIIKFPTERPSPVR